METAATESMTGGANAVHNLNHVYFFLDQTAPNGHTPTSSKNDTDITPTKNAPQTPKSRDSSPGSTGSSATLTGSASTTSTNLNPHAASFSPTAFSPSASFSPQDARSSPPPSIAGELYEMREVEGKGLGIFATTSIPRGTRIISERPLMKIPENFVQLAWGSYCRLENWQKDAFDKLHAYTPENLPLENTSRMCLIDYSDEAMEDQDTVDELVAEQVRVMSIFSVNNFNLIPTGLAVYATTSRLNHSCVPNTFHGFNANIHRFTVHAVRDIEPGEELTINYMGAPADFMVRTQRLEHLRTSYGFTCTCHSCSDRTSASDIRRDLLNNICWGLNEYERGAPPAYPFVADTPAQAFQLAVDAVKILSEEKLYTMGLLKACHAASKHALALEDWHSALRYAIQESEVQHSCLGTEVQDLVKDGVAASQWIGNVRRTVTKALGEKQAKKVFDKYKDEPAMFQARRKEEQNARKAARKAEQKRMLREEKARAIGNGENGEHNAGSTWSPKGAGKQAEPNSWAKVVAGGGVQASGKSNGWPVLEQENGTEGRDGW